MARKAVPKKELIEMGDSNNQALIDLQNQGARLEQAYSNDQRSKTAMIHERVGRLQMGRMITKLVTVSDLVFLQKIKESKEFKGLQIDVEGELVTITTWAEYCQHVEGRSREAIDNDLLNFNLLGDELFKALHDVGLGPAKMRSLRQLPDDERTALLEAAESGNKDAFVELAEDFLSNSAKQKVEQAKRITELQEDNEAKDQLIATKNQQIDKLHTDSNAFKRLPPDEQVLKFREQVSECLDEAELIIRTNVRDALLQLAEREEEIGLDPSDYSVNRLNLLRDALNDVASAVGAEKHWEMQ